MGKIVPITIILETNIFVNFFSNRLYYTLGYIMEYY